MNRKHAALLELVKRGGTLNERRVACEKLFLLTGKDYSYFLPKEEQQPETRPTLVRRSVFDLMKEIKGNLPIIEDVEFNCYRGKNGFVLTKEVLGAMDYGDYLLLISAMQMAIHLAVLERANEEAVD